MKSDLVDAVPLARSTRIPRARRWLGSISPQQDSTRRAAKPRPLVASFTIFARTTIRVRRLKRYLAARPALARRADCARDCERGARIARAISCRARRCCPRSQPLWTHNDLHASNLFWSDTSDDAPVPRQSSISVWPTAPTPSTIMAHAIERNIVEWLALDARSAQPGEGCLCTSIICTRCLRVMNLCAPLSDEEAAALAPMAALCHAEFALSEADYFLGVLHSPEKARSGLRRLARGPRALVSQRGGQKLLKPCADGPETRTPGECAHDDLVSNHALSRRKLARDCRLRHHRCRHLAHHPAPAHLLASGSCRRLPLSRRLLSRPAFFRCTAADFFVAFTLYGWWHWWRGVREEGEVRVVPLALRESARRAGCRGSVGSFAAWELADAHFARLCPIWTPR